MWRMPAEWEPHERTWMAWPSSGYALGDDEAAAHEARRAWADVALAVASFEPVSLVVTPEAASIARAYLDRRTPHHITLVEAELDANIIHGPEDGSHFAPGYYSILFEDPDGIRVEFNYVPGKGHFGDKGRLGPEGPGPSDKYGEEGIY